MRALFGSLFRCSLALAVGTVFQQIPAAEAATYQVIYDLPEGSEVPDMLAVDRSGRLFGTYDNYVPPVYGTLFVIVPPVAGSSVWTSKIVYQFSLTDPAIGTGPAGGVIVKGATILGTTGFGGIYGLGTAYTLTGPEPDTFTALHAFAGAAASSQDGNSPGSGLTQGLGKLYYGTTGEGGIATKENGGAGPGTVFAVSSSTAAPQYSVLHRFGGVGDGIFPNRARLAIDSQGRLFGVTGYGGANNLGVVFMMQRVNGGWEEQVLYSFTAAPGLFNPFGNVVLDKQGNVYGCASGGTYSYGGIYQLTPPSQQGGAWTQTVINTFGPNKPIPLVNASFPGCSLTYDAATGELFGVSEAGGLYDQGDIFELNPPAAGKVAWTRSDVHSFTNRAGDGWGPVAPPLQVGKSFFGGNLAGTIYEFTP